MAAAMPGPSMAEPASALLSAWESFKLDLRRPAAPAPSAEDAVRLLRLQAEPVDRSSGEVLTARVVVDNERGLVLQIDLDLEIDWQPGKKVEVVLEDGRRVPARVQGRRTTRAGRFRAGYSIRLALDPVDGDVASVRLADGTEILVARG